MPNDRISNQGVWQPLLVMPSVSQIRWRRSPLEPGWFVSSGEQICQNDKCLARDCHIASGGNLLNRLNVSAFSA